MIAFLGPSKFCSSPMTCAILPSWTPSGKAKWCVTLQIFGVVVPCTLFLQFCMAPHTHFSIFCKKVVPAYTGSTFLKNDSKQRALKNVGFETLLCALAPSPPLRRALIRRQKSCSREGPGHFFHLNPFCTNHWPLISAICFFFVCC